MFVTTSTVTNRRGFRTTGPATDSSVSRLTVTGLMVMALWLLIVIDGLWTYATVKALGSRIIPLSPLFFLGLIIVAVEAVLSERKFIAGTSAIAVTSWLFCAYLLGVTMYHQHIDGGPIAQLWRGYYLNYFYILLLPFCGFLSGRFSSKAAAKIIVITAIGLGLFGTIQHFSNDLFAVGRLIAIESGAFNLGFSGKTRANGLFAHSEDLGFFLSLAAAIVVAHFVKSRTTIHRIVFFFVLAILAIGCYATLTRSSYIALVFSSAVALFLSSKKIKITLNTISIPLGLLILSLAIFYSRTIIDSLFPGVTIFSSSSLEERIAGTNYYINQLTRQGIYDLLLGKGWYLFSSVHATVPIDNGFIGVILNTGLIGLLFWITLTFQLWKFMLRKAVDMGDPTLTGITAFYSCWLGLSIFGVVNLFQFSALLFFLLIPANHCNLIAPKK